MTAARTERSWKLPLAQPPHIFMLGLGNHGPLKRWDRYRIEGLWCLHFYRYHGELRIDGESFPIAPGHVSVTPPSAVLEYSYHDTPSLHVVAHFRLEEERDGGHEIVELPAMKNLGDDFGELSHAMEEAVAWFAFTPQRARARLWDLLWRLAAIHEKSDDTSTRATSAAVQRALQVIEHDLSSPISVAALARRVNLSHNQFTRIFAASVGSTPATYIRSRRAARAAHLLQHSTLPAKAIATQCGLGDLQAFNKTLRRELGKSPRELRP